MRIATRGSELAKRQTKAVADAVTRCHGITPEWIVVQSRGDRITDKPLREVEGVGFFTTEIENALLDQKADVAVHSYKDLPTEPISGLTIAAVLPRGSASDLLLIRPDSADPNRKPWPLRAGARVGTSAVRRQVQLQSRMPDVVAVDLRGNVPTRVAHLRDGRFDAVILAKAGLERLGLDLSDLVVVDLLAFGFFPAPAQGAIAVQCRTDDTPTVELLAPLNHPDTARCVNAERELSRLLGGTCSAALGCLATLEGERIKLDAVWTTQQGEPRSCQVTADTPAAAAALAHDTLVSPKKSRD